MANLQRYILPACLMLSVGATTLGCGDGVDSRDGNLRVDVIGWGPGVDGTLGFQTTLPNFPGAQNVRVSLTEPATGRVVESETFAVAQRNARLPKLESSDGLRMQFDVLDAAMQPMAYGATPLFSFSGTDYVQSFRIQVDPVNSFSPVGAVLSGSMAQSTLDPRSISSMGIERWLGRVGHAAVTMDGGNKALIVGGGDAISPVRAGADPNFRTPSDGRALSLHDDLMEFDPNSGYFTDLSFNPATNTVFPGGADRLMSARAFHTVTDIGDNKYLVIGGYGEENGALSVLSSIEMIDLSLPAGSRVRPLLDANGMPLRLSGARVFHSATYRPVDNSVVVAGGVGPGGPTDVLATVEVINLNAGTVVPGPALATPRAQHEAVLMADNQTIWILGGRDSSQALSSTSTIGVSGFVTPNATMLQARYDFEAVRSSDVAGGGLVVVAIGGFTDMNGAATGSVELGKLGRDSFNACGACTLSTPRGGLEAVELPNTRDIVVLDGRKSDNSRAGGVEVLKFASLSQGNAYSASATGAQSVNGRADSTATLLANGKILLTGGIGANSATLRDAEYFTPSDFVAAPAASEF
ncbi:hypothetical protein DFR33_102369 [Bradymonas sediminis]|uniref:Uncharacterized protein n=2 Tax=Bradymonas sediminis TaxID=1548548 RepID=A0A2Z4FLG4_9DELT|nr:hypothetical protein DN745_09365 [Bradymonas sediminis]TDP76732.1 hypothetical protein DFR33_102369 [Bradymonas sediminis]